MLPSEALRRRRIERLAAEISQREGAALEKARVIAQKRDAYWHRFDASAGDCALRMFARGNGAVGFEPR